MHKVFNVSSYAKINLHLDVGRMRKDGFHQIYSVFHKISLCDIIEIIISNIEKNILIPDNLDSFITINGNFSCPKTSNIIFKAATRFMEESDLYFKVDFNVEKRIPEGAGLGGGSSNGAYILSALNTMMNFPLSEKEIFNIAIELGSDLPFFLSSSAAAIVTGRGEIVTPIEIEAGENQREIIIVFPDFKINTGEAYSWIDKKLKEKDYAIKEIDIEAELKKKPSQWRFFNSFTVHLKERYAVYENIFNIFKKNGAGYFEITGSGSAVYAIFDNKKQGGTAFKELSDIYVNVKKELLLDS